MASVPPPRLFDYATIKKNLPANKAMADAIENCFGMLAKDLVDVPLPMHIGMSIFILHQTSPMHSQTLNLFHELHRYP